MDPKAVKRHAYYWWKVYTPQQIKDINKHINKHLIKAKDNPASNVLKTSTVRMIPYRHIEVILKEFFNKSLYTNFLNWGYHLYPLLDGEYLNYNTYSAGKKSEYGWHLDGIPEKNAVSDIKLTCLLNLSEKDYQGGDLYINMGGGKTLIKELTPGNMVIFSSFLCHKVTPVTKGTRNTLALWLTGPKLV